MSASKFTPENRGALIERTAAGVSLLDAARAVRVREATVKSWVTRGRREREGEYAEFVAALDAARQQARGRPGPLSRKEFELRLAEAVRGGSVQAMKLWAELHLPDEPPDEEPADEFDELRERRRTRAG
jgi:transposase